MTDQWPGGGRTGVISTTPVLPENFIYFLMCLRITTGFFYE